jgi:UPF0755 protein
MKKLVKFIKNKIFLSVVGGIVLLILIFLFVCLSQLNVPLNATGSEKIFIVKEGEGLEKISENLESEELIRNKWMFFYYLWLQKKAGNLQAGEYALSPAMNIPEIANKIIKGEVVENWVKVTVPEGWRNEQIETRLTAFNLIKTGEKLPEDKEGYLFPDTYYFYKDSTINDIAEKMLANFDKKITEDLRKEIERQGKELYDILIMASLIEKEVITEEDMAIVSNVFWNRLEDDYPLESCATIAYILGIDKWRYSVEDTKIQSPYNTYINKGLPPTPINNPGLSAIKAAIYPIETDYYFFLTDPETGNTIFSETLQEHNVNKRKYFY